MTGRASFVGMRKRLMLLVLAVSLSALTGHAADNLGVLGAHPRWNVLENYQETITHDDFFRLIENVYCAHGIGADLLAIDDNSARILTNREANSFFTLRFAHDQASSKRVPRLWRTAKSLPPLTEGKPLSDLRIALDPGHLGGKWSQM